MNLSFLNNFSFSGARDWMVILIFLVAAFIYGLAMGRQRLIMVILGTYFSLVLTSAIPWSKLSFIIKESPPSSTAQIFIFLALILGFYFLIPHSALRSALGSRGRRARGNWLHLFVFAFLQISLILSAIINFLPTKAINSLSPFTQTIFVGPWPQFLWLLLPILAIMFLRSRQYYDVGD